MEKNKEKIQEAIKDIYSVEKSFDNQERKAICVPLNCGDDFESLNFFDIKDEISKKFKKDFTGEYKISSGEYILFFYE